MRMRIDRRVKSFNLKLLESLNCLNIRTSQSTSNKIWTALFFISTWMPFLFRWSRGIILAPGKTCGGLWLSFSKRGHFSHLRGKALWDSGRNVGSGSKKALSPIDSCRRKSFEIYRNRGPNFFYSERIYALGGGCLH